jgi:peptidoglycan lytic transglycosylase
MRMKHPMSKVALFGAVLTVLSPCEMPRAATRPESVTRARNSHVTYASWYGWDFARRRTASGEMFNPLALTAAHRTLPLGSKVRVTNLGNGRSVVLRITDRGPYHKGRGIDLSREAARQLRMVDQGVARVRVDQLPIKPEIDPVSTAIAAWPSALEGGRAVSL